MSREYWLVRLADGTYRKTLLGIPSKVSAEGGTKDEAHRYQARRGAYGEVFFMERGGVFGSKVVHVTVKPRVQKFWIVRRSRRGAIWFWVADRRGASSKREEAYRFRNRDDAFAAAVRSGGEVEPA